MRIIHSVLPLTAVLVGVGTAATAPKAARAQSDEKPAPTISFTTELMKKNQEILAKYGMDKSPMLPGEKKRTDAEWNDWMQKFDNLRERSGDGIQDVRGLFSPDMARTMSASPSGTAATLYASAAPPASMTPTSGATARTTAETTARFAAPARDMMLGLAQSAHAMALNAAQNDDGVHARRWQSWENYYLNLARQTPPQITTGMVLATNVAAFSHASARARQAGYLNAATLFRNHSVFWYSLGSQIQANRQPVQVMFPPELFNLSAEDVQNIQRQHQGAFMK